MDEESRTRVTLDLGGENAYEALRIIGEMVMTIPSVSLDISMTPARIVEEVNSRMDLLARLSKYHSQRGCDLAQLFEVQDV